MNILSKRFSLKKYFKVILFIISCFIISTFIYGCKGDTGPAGAAGPAGADGADGASPTVIVPDDYEDIQGAIDDLRGDVGSVFIRAGLYTLTQGIHINKSNISLSGEQGTILKLGDEAQQPVILIGTDTEIPIERISYIEIENIEIDGNDENQTSEVDPDKIWIRNNAIDVRMVDYLWISNVNLHDARSGALVVSWDSNLFLSMILLFITVFSMELHYTTALTYKSRISYAMKTTRQD